MIQYLRRKRQLRGSRHTQKDKDRRGSIPDAISISERPPEVKDRAVPGHWEGDLICGPNHSFIGTLVERHSRYVMLMKLSDRKTETVVNALIKHSKKLPDELYKSLTWDRGMSLPSLMITRPVVSRSARTVSRERSLPAIETISGKG